MNTKFAGKTDEAVRKATGKSWDEWFKILDSAKASEMPHKDIVKMLHDKGLIKAGKGWPATRTFNEGWWAQSIVVGYEQKIGRRVYGAKTAGNYSVTIGKTLDATVDDVLKLWESLVKNKKEFNKVKVKGDSWTSRTKDWRYWKVDLMDGSKLMASIGSSAILRQAQDKQLRTSPKGDKKSAFSVTMDKLKDKKAVEEWRKFWREFFSTNKL